MPDVLDQLDHVAPTPEPQAAAQPAAEPATAAATPDSQRSFLDIATEVAGATATGDQATGQPTAAPTAPSAPTPPTGDASQPTAPTAPQAPQQFSVCGALNQLGYQHAFESDQQAFDWLLQSLHQTAELQELAQYGQQVLPYLGEFQTYLQQRNQAGAGTAPATAAAPASAAADPAAQTPAAATPAWQPPPYDAAWERHARFDPETGLYKPVDQYASLAAVEGLNKHHQFQQNWLNEFRKNPYEFVSKGLDDRFKQVEQAAYQRAVQYIQAQRAQEQTRNVITSTLTGNSAWMHQRDTAGNVLVDGRGFPVLTENGRQYALKIEELERAGVNDPQTQDRLAKQLLWGAAGQPPAQATAGSPPNTNGHAAGNGANGNAPAAADNTPAARRAAFAAPRTLRDALRTPNREGTVANEVFDPTLPQNGQLSFYQLAVQEARKQGHAIPDFGPSVY